MLEKTLENPLDSKEIQPVHPKGNQSWIFIGRTDAEAETPILLATWFKKLTHLKRPWRWERLTVRGEGDNRGWDGWMASPTQWTWVWVSSGSWWRTGRPGMLPSMGSQSDTTEQMNWTELHSTKGSRTCALWRKTRMLLLELHCWLSGNTSACQCRWHGFDPWSVKIPHVTEDLSLCATTIESVL